MKFNVSSGIARLKAHYALFTFICMAPETLASNPLKTGKSHACTLMQYWSRNKHIDAKWRSVRWIEDNEALHDTKEYVAYSYLQNPNQNTATLHFSWLKFVAYTYGCQLHSKGGGDPL
jgi:hypothetical protein